MPDTLTIQIRLEDAERYRTCRAVLLEMEETGAYDLRPGSSTGTQALRFTHGGILLRHDYEFERWRKVPFPIQPGGVLVCDVWMETRGGLDMSPCEQILRTVSSIRPVRMRAIQIGQCLDTGLAVDVSWGGDEIRSAMKHQWNRDHPGQPWRPDLWAWFLELEVENEAL